MNKRLVWLLVILVIVIISAGAVGGYYYYTTKDEQEVKTTPKINVEPSRKIIPSKDTSVPTPTNIKPLPPIPVPPQ